jgi:ribonuclease P protein component
VAQPNTLMTLRRRGDFLRIQSAGRRFKQQYMTVLVGRGPDTNPRVGFTISRKVGTAVKRNRVRRRLREITRTLKANFNDGLDYVIIAYPNAVLASASVLQEDLLCALQRVR